MENVYETMHHLYTKRLYHHSYHCSIGERCFFLYRFMTHSMLRAITAGCMGVCLCGLGGCYHQGVLDNTVQLINKMQGGVIATQRPPPPGQYGHYPLVGPYPTPPSDLLSPQVRTLLTQKLLRDRALTYRTVAVSGSLTPVIPPLPESTESKMQKGGGESLGTSSTKAESGRESLPTGTFQKTQSLTGHSVVASGDTTQGKKYDRVKTFFPATLFPAIREGQNVISSLQTPPQIPQAPPTPPQIKGVTLSLETKSDHLQTPNYDLSEVQGTFFHFLSDSDQLSEGQDTLLDGLVKKTPHGPFYIRGFGHTSSLDVQQQAGAVKLGVLRALCLARALIARGVPPDKIHIRGDAFGTGARVAIKPNWTS